MNNLFEDCAMFASTVIVVAQGMSNKATHQS